MCAAFAYLHTNKAEGCFMTLGNVQQNEKLTLFIHYFVEQWMETRMFPSRCGM